MLTLKFQPAFQVYLEICIQKSKERIFIFQNSSSDLHTCLIAEICYITLNSDLWIVANFKNVRC